MATGNSKTKWNGILDLPDKGTASANGVAIELTYPGKTPEPLVLATPPVAVTKLWSGVNQSALNRLYYGDNLPVLANLLRDPEIKGQVKLVYIDPPFATRSVFQSRNQTDAYTDLLSPPQYLEFLRQRLILLRELLAPDGSIYLHLDQNMAFQIKVLLDEIFGERNFRNWITRKKCNPKNYTRKVYGNISDYILFYTKSEVYTWNRPVNEWLPEQIKKEYPCIEPETGRRYKKVPVHAPGLRNGETGGLWRDKLPPPGKHWQFTPQTLDELDARGEIYWSPTGNPRRKVYLDQSEGIPVQDIWLDFRDAHNQNIPITGYPTEKNPALLERIIQASSNPGDLVLDCFAGSGTTLDVAARLGRHWIGIDNSPEALTTILKRFANGLAPMGDFVTDRSGSVKTVGESYQLSFTELESTVLQTEPNQPIKNFTLYVTQPYTGDLAEALAWWQIKSRDT